MKHLYKILLFVLLCGLCWGSQAQDLKIISFNIRYNSWENIDGENGWPNRKGAVAKMIFEERPAAIGLQEALIDQLQYLDTVLTCYRRIGVGRNDGKEAGEFMAMFILRLICGLPWEAGDFGSHPLQLDRPGRGDCWSLADLRELGSKSLQRILSNASLCPLQ